MQGLTQAYAHLDKSTKTVTASAMLQSGINISGNITKEALAREGKAKKKKKLSAPN